MRRFGQVSVLAFGGAGVAAAGFASAGAVLGLKTAANLETATIGFTRLLGSGRQAQKFIGQLKSFAARTPFELPGLIDAARGLLGAGTAAKNVIPILTSLGDASGALGLDQERFGRVMLAVTQIMNRGKVQAEELNQITEAGIPVWQLLAKATGKPIPELQKLMQSGGLLAKDVLPKLFEQMQKDYGGGMEAQSKSLNGVWSTFKDTVSLTLSDALQPLLPMLKTALPVAGEAFQGAIEDITGAFTAKDGLNAKAREWWETNGPAVKEAFTKAKDEVVKLGKELGDLKKDWDDNKAAVEGLMDALKPLAGLILPTVSFLVHRLANDEIGGRFGLIAQLGWLARAFTFVFKRAIQELRPFVSFFLLAMERILQAALSTVSSIPGGSRSGLGKNLRNAINSVRGWREGFNREMDKLKDERVDVKARAAVEIARSTRMYLKAANVPGFRAKGGLTRLGEVAIVGEEGPELVQFRNPARVYTAPQTRQMLSRGMAGGGDVGVRFSGEGSLAALSGWHGKVMLATERIGERFAARLAASIGQGLSAAIKRAIPDIGVGGDLGAWIAQAIRITGVSPSWGPALARRARFESGGNPRAINLWDVNAQRGTPSMGLMQTIGPTFNAYAWDGLRDIWNPVHNLVAAIRYILARYGSIFAIDPPVRGYAGGGTIPEDVFGMGRSGRGYVFHGGETVKPRGGGDVHVHFHGPVYGDRQVLSKQVRDDIRAALRREGRPVTV